MMKGPHIAIVGGGPAGATCARLLATAGARVTLFEGSPSAEKPCGGGVPAHALEEFPELADPSLPRRVVREVLVYSPSNHRASIRVPRGLHIFRRLELDSFLRRRAVAAGAHLAQARVVRIRQTPAGAWELMTSEGAAGSFDVLVSADGVCGVVRRALAGAYHGGQLTLALYGYTGGVARSEMVLKFFGDLDGYFWAFPRTDQVSVGICASRRAASAERLQEELHRFVEEHYPEGRLPAGSLKGYFIPHCSRPPAAQAGGPRGGNWALIGDAAGFVDPMTREGIAYAMRSAASLARALIESGRLRTPDLSSNLRWAHRHGEVFYREPFLERMTRLAAGSSAIRKVLADLLEGRQPYGGLKARLLRNALPCGIQVGLRVLEARARAVLRGGAA